MKKSKEEKVLSGEEMEMELLKLKDVVFDREEIKKRGLEIIFEKYYNMGIIVDFEKVFKKRIEKKYGKKEMKGINIGTFRRRYNLYEYKIVNGKRKKVGLWLYVFLNEEELIEKDLKENKGLYDYLKKRERFLEMCRRVGWDGINRMIDESERRIELKREKRERDLYDNENWGQVPFVRPVVKRRRNIWKGKKVEKEDGTVFRIKEDGTLEEEGKW